MNFKMHNIFLIEFYSCHQATGIKGIGISETMKLPEGAHVKKH